MGKRGSPQNDDYTEYLSIGPIGGVDATTPPYWIAPTNYASMSNLLPNQQYGGYATMPGRINALLSNLPSVPNGIGKFAVAGEPDVYIFACDEDGEGVLYAAVLDGTPTKLTLPAGVTLTPGQNTTFAPLQAWMFLTNGVDTPLKIDTSLNVTLWGIVAPSTAPTGVTSGVGPLLGTYYYCETFSNDVQESSQGAVSAPIVAANNSITVTPTATTTDTQVTTRNLYRLGGGLGQWRLVHSQAVDDLTPFLDVTADANLNGQAIVIFRDPPAIFKTIAAYQERMWGFGTPDDPSQFWWSNYGEPWGFNPDVQTGEAGFNDFGDTAVAAVSGVSLMLLHKERSTYAVYGNSDTTFICVPLFPVGCCAPRSACADDNGVFYWLSRQGAQMYNGGRAVISDGGYQQSNIKKLLDAFSLDDLASAAAFIIDRMYVLSVPEGNTSFVWDNRSQSWYPLAIATNLAYFDLESDTPVIATNIQNIGEIDRWFADLVNGDLGNAITASVTSRITDGGDIAATKSWNYLYVEAPPQPGAFCNVYIFSNPGDFVVPWGTNIDLSVNAPRHRVQLPLEQQGSEVQISLQTVSKAQVTIHRAALYGTVMRKHTSEGPTDG